MSCSTHHRCNASLCYKQNNTAFKEPQWFRQASGGERPGVHEWAMQPCMRSAGSRRPRGCAAMLVRGGFNLHPCLCCVARHGGEEGPGQPDSRDSGRGQRASLWQAIPVAPLTVPTDHPGHLISPDRPGCPVCYGGCPIRPLSSCHGCPYIAAGVSNPIFAVMQHVASGGVFFVIAPCPDRVDKQRSTLTLSPPASLQLDASPLDTLSLRNQRPPTP
jgi:hypothetical protein